MEFETINGKIIGYVIGKGTFEFDTKEEYFAAYWEAFEEWVKWA